MTWADRQLERFRAVDPLYIDGSIAVVASVIALVTVSSETVLAGQAEPTALAVLTATVTCMPIAARRRYPLGALAVSCVAITSHIIANFPGGGLPVAVLFLTYSLAVWSSPRRSVVGLGLVLASLVVLGFSNAPGLGFSGAASYMLQLTIAWAVGFAIASRRQAVEARIREAEERANVERQRAGRMMAEERLRIAQELHDVVAHSMSVIAVQAGVGAHVLHDRPDQARMTLDAIAATSRGTLSEMRRLLGVLRDSDGNRTHLPAPGISDVPRLVDEVRAAGVPVNLSVEGTSEMTGSAIELSAYRLVQEALTNVIKHAGAPTRVEVTVRQERGSLTVEVVDNGRGAAADAAAIGHGLLGMRERVEVWGGELTAGPIAGGGYRVKALLPCGETS